MFGYRMAARSTRRIKKYGQSTRPLRLEILERRDQPAGFSMSVLPALHETLIEPAIDFRALSGLSPAIVRNAYGFDAANIAHTPGDGSGETIAIVTAFNHPYIQSDLRRFNELFGLPEPPSFSVVSATTTTHAGWAMEAALDVQWAHAIAPGANLLLVQAASDSVTDMLQAVDYARRQPGVSVVSMSWGAVEFVEQTRFDSILRTPFGHDPVSFVAASGDFGAAAGVNWPASSPNVLAVGGTRLIVDERGNYVGESAWSGSGGGISGYYGGNRAVPDVAYAADPGSGFLVYNSLPDSQGRTGWFRVGGTSAGAPQWAGLVAIANQSRASNNALPVANLRNAISSMSSGSFNDIVTGSNGFEAVAGFDLATGLGSPRAASVIAQLASAKGPAATQFVGPIQNAELNTSRRTATAPPSRDVTQALIQAAVAQQNAIRAALYVQSAPAQTPTSVETRTQEVVAPPILTTESATATYTSWDQSIRAGSGSTEKQEAGVPVQPGDGNPGPAPANAVPVPPPPAAGNVRAKGIEFVMHREASRIQSSENMTVAESAESPSVESNDQTMIGLAAAFCFLGGCFVGIEPRMAAKTRPTLPQ